MIKVDSLPKQDEMEMAEVQIPDLKKEKKRNWPATEELGPEGLKTHSCERWNIS